MSGELENGDELEEASMSSEASLGSLLLAARTRAHISQEEAARACHISVSFFSWLERGKGITDNPRVLSKIAEGLLLDDNTLRVSAYEELKRRAARRLGLHYE